MNAAPPYARPIRRSSATIFWGMPLYDIAMGGDPETGETRGYARGWIAIGDMASGGIAIGGIAKGGIAIGGVALGLISFGGVSLGALAALGGLAVGSFAVGGAAIGLLAVGGGAVGLVAVGGGAYGHYYAMGGGAAGQYVLDATRQDPEAIAFFESARSWIPTVGGMIDQMKARGLF
jgi:hypothetical protein